MLCIKLFVSFGLHAPYQYHDKHTLRYMNVALKEFHDYKAVFLKWRINKSVNAEVENLSRKLREESDENLDAKHNEGLTTATLQKEKKE